MADLVQMKALKFGTTTGVRGILHVDPREEADHVAQYPLVSEADAANLEKQGLAERFDGDVPEAKSDEYGLEIGERAAVIVEANADAENSVDVTTGLSTRDTTAFEAPPESLSNTGNSFIGVDDGKGSVASEETAPAGKGKGKAAAAPASE